VAAVQGHVLGAGFGLATCADVIVDSRNALFGLAEAKGGIMTSSAACTAQFSKRPAELRPFHDGVNSRTLVAI
jgi:enoyl-CoA hydratase/carnithine racemase